MLNAGEGTFCDAEVWVMLQLSPTLSLGDQANTIVLPLRVYPFHFSPAAVPLFAPKSHLIPLFASICQKRLDLHSASSFHLRQTKCTIGDDMGGRIQESGGDGREI